MEFQDRQPYSAQLMPERDYALTVTALTNRISQGQKTAGRPLYILDFAIEGGGACSDILIDAEENAWRVDVFLKACGFKLAKGAKFEFRKDWADQAGALFIDVVGLRCWAHVIVDTFRTRNGADRKGNKVGAYLLNKPPL